MIPSLAIADTIDIQVRCVRVFVLDIVDDIEEPLGWEGSQYTTYILSSPSEPCSGQLTPQEADDSSLKAMNYKFL